jgi:hypothetical protein
MITEYLHLLHDVPHILFETTWDLFVLGLGYLPLKKWLRRHDREKHNVVHDD